jgi:hypothetical protein
MANLAKWAAGALSGWSTSANAGFASADLAFFNSLASGSVVVASSAIANSTNLDLLGEVAVDFCPSANPTAGQAWVDVYLLPLGRDGTTYGDGTPSGAAQSVAPARQYLRKSIGIRPVNSGFSAGTTVLHGVSEPFALPRGDFVLAVGPTMGAALHTTASMSISLRTTVENLNG